jgi:hypothetical protein
MSLFVMQENNHPSSDNEELVYLALLIKESRTALQAYQRIGVGFVVDKKWFQADYTTVFRIE